MKLPNYDIKDLNLVIACIGKNDGFGAQFLNCINGLAFARFHQLEYRHSEFEYLEHGILTEDAEKLINFKKSFDKVDPSSVPLFFSHIAEIADNLNPGKFFTESVLNELRKIFFTNKHQYNLKQKQISIHIRRGDVTSKDFLRWIPNSYYKKIINYCKNKYPLHKIVIYSEGSVEDFSELATKDVTFKLNGNALDIFVELTMSDILITSKSAFSYCAAILSDKKVYYIPFWHAPLPHWNTIKIQESVLEKAKNKLGGFYNQYILHIKAYAAKFFQSWFERFKKLKFLLMAILLIPIKIIRINNNIQITRKIFQSSKLKLQFDRKKLPEFTGIFSVINIGYENLYWEDSFNNPQPLSKNPYFQYLDLLLNGNFNNAFARFAENYPDLTRNQIMGLINSFNVEIIAFRKGIEYCPSAKLSSEGKLILIEEINNVVLSSFLGDSNKISVRMLL